MINFNVDEKFELKKNKCTASYHQFFFTSFRQHSREIKTH